MVKANGPEVTRADPDPESATRASRPRMPLGARLRFSGKGSGACGSGDVKIRYGP